MRRWKMPGGKILAEVRVEDPAPDGYALQDDQGRPVKGVVFHVLGPDGRVEWTYGSSQGSDQEHLYWCGHVIEGDELRAWFNDVNTDVKVEKITATMTVEISRLEEVR